MKKNYKKTVLLDLDGVLNEYCGNYSKNYIPQIKHGAEQFLSSLNKDYEIIIFSTRDSKIIKKWLDKNKISKYITSITNIKIPAFVHVDDRCISFEGDFEKTLKDIIAFKPYWK